MIAQELAEVLDVPREIEPRELAQRIAALGGLRAPTCAESIEILVALTLDVASKALAWTDSPFYVGMLHALDIPELDWETRWLEQVVAARDLGLLATPLDGPPTFLGRSPEGVKGSLQALFCLVWESALGDLADTIVGRLRERGFAP